MAPTLDRAPLRTPLVLVSATGERDVVRRLSEMGLRAGVQFTCVQRSAGGGRIVDVAGSRIALGRSLLTVIVAEPVDTVLPGSAHRGSAHHGSGSGVPS